MNLIQLVRAIEELVFEVMAWFVMIPKTLAKLISSPAWGLNYVAGQLSRPLEQRFDDYSSPITLWILLAVLPYFWVLTPLSRFFPGDFKHQLFLVALFVAVGPLGFATGFVAARKEVLSKSNLRTYFYVQCYCFTPAFLFSLPAIFLLVRYQRSCVHQYPFVVFLSLGIAVLWLFIIEAMTLRQLLNVSWSRAGVLFFPLLFGSYMVAWAAATILLLLIAGTASL